MKKIVVLLASLLLSVSFIAGISALSGNDVKVVGVNTYSSIAYRKDTIDIVFTKRAHITDIGNIRINIDLLTNTKTGRSTNTGDFAILPWLTLMGINVLTIYLLRKKNWKTLTALTLVVALLSANNLAMIVGKGNEDDQGDDNGNKKPPVTETVDEEDGEESEEVTPEEEEETEDQENEDSEETEEGTTNGVGGDFTPFADVIAKSDYYIVEMFSEQVLRNFEVTNIKVKGGGKVETLLSEGKIIGYIYYFEAITADQSLEYTLALQDLVDEYDLDTDIELAPEALKIVRLDGSVDIINTPKRIIINLCLK